jgi:centrin-1
MINKQVLNELNLCRSNPKKYSQKLSKTLEYYNRKIYHKPGSLKIETNEGVENIKACIAYLSTIRPSPELKWSQSLAIAAKFHADDIGPLGIMGHTSSDGTEASERIGKYCEWSGQLGENIDYGNNTAEDIVVNLLIDDGVLARGHRLNIMKRDHNFVGVALGPHAKYQHLCVIVFAEEIISEFYYDQYLFEVQIQSNIKYKIPIATQTKEAYEIFDNRNYEKSSMSQKSILETDLLDFDRVGQVKSIDSKSFFDTQDLEISDITAFQKKSELSLNHDNLDFNEFLEVLTKRSEPDTYNISDTEISDIPSTNSIKNTFVPQTKTVQKLDFKKYSRLGLSQDEILEIKDAFDMLDDENKGTINPHKLKKMMEAEGWVAKNTTIFNMICNLELNGIDEVDFEQFLEMIDEQKFDYTSMKEVKKLFDLFDVERTGYIELKNLQKIVKELGESLDEYEITELIEKSDLDGDGKVSLHDFYSIMNKKIY